MGLYIPARPRRFAACASFGATESLRPLLCLDYLPHRFFQRLIKAGDVQAVYQRVVAEHGEGQERLAALLEVLSPGDARVAVRGQGVGWMSDV